MKTIINLVSERVQQDLTQKISTRVQTAMFNYSDLQDKGRFFSGLDFMHFVHEVLPSVVKSVIDDYVEEVEA